MGYVLKAVLSSAQHPEYGQITVPFPIPDEKYDRMIELLEPLEIGDALRQDCRVDELDSFYTVLNRLVGSLVNFDELDYLAKRLDSFDDGEAAQFQGMACKLGVSNIKDFINLTFCCQQATVITDFSDLDAIGRQHYMTMQGGGCRIEELERLDGRKFALDLILNHLEGRITPYGVVYDEYVDEQIEASEVQSDLLPKSGKLVNLLSAYEELQQIPDEERITRLAPGAFGYCLDPNVPDERLHTAYQQALSALELESDEIQEAESFTSRDEIISRMRDCLLAKELTAGDKVLFVATEPYGGPGDFDLRGGVIESVDEKDKTCSVRGTFFTMEKVPLHYVLGRYNPAVGEEHYGVRGIVPFFCEDKELAGYYLNEVRTMWDVEMGEEQDLSM